MTSYDVVVIGGGAAGGSCAEKANEAGLRVAMIERDALGGTCLNYGCDPTKTVLHSAKLLHQAQQARRYGLDIPEASQNWRWLQDRIQVVQEQMRGGTETEARQLKRERGIDLIIGEASFRSPHEVNVNGRTLQADQIVIATGTEPLVPDITGLARSRYVTNKTIFDLHQPPPRLAIIGGGPIGVEFAQLFTRLGTKVHLFEAEACILPKEDPELTDDLSNILRSEGVEIQTQAKITAVTLSDTGKKLTIVYESGYENYLVVDELLVSAGRKTAVDALNLPAAGVTMRDGRIQVDEALQTTVPHIWAAGDVSADYPFTHVAWRQGQHVAENIINQQAKPFAKEPIPWVTYTDPELAHVGQTEAELEAAGIPYSVASHSMQSVARAITMGQEHGRVKLLVGEGNQILGGHILASNAGELIAPVILAMKAKIPATALGETVWPYPTMSAVLGEAVNNI